MKEAKPTQHKKKSKEPLYGFMDGWNFGLGFWFAFVAAMVFIIPALALIVWLALLIIGAFIGSALI